MFQMAFIYHFTEQGFHWGYLRTQAIFSAIWIQLSAESSVSQWSKRVVATHKGAEV